MSNHKTPSWYDESKLCRIEYSDDGEIGWAINMGEGKYRMVNSSLGALCGDHLAASWGDLVEMKPGGGLLVLERYDLTLDLIENI